MRSMIERRRWGIASSLSAVLTALGLGAAGMVQAQSITVNGVAFDLYQGLPVPANLQGPLTITTAGSLPIVIPEGLWTVQNGQVFIAQSLAPQIAAAGGATGIISVPATGVLASAAGLVATAGGATEDEEAGDDEAGDDQAAPTQTSSLPVITSGPWSDFSLTNSADGVAAGLGKGEKIHVLGVDGTNASIRTIPFDVFIANSGDGVETVAGSVPDPFPFVGAFTEENDLIAVYDGTDAYTFNPAYGKSAANTGYARVLAHPTDATTGVNAFFNAAQGNGLILAAFNYEGLEEGSADLEVLAYDPLTNTYDVLGFNGVTSLYDIVLADEDPTTASALTAFDGLDIAAISGFASTDITSIQIADFDDDGDADLEMLITTNTNYIVVDLDG